MLKIGAFSKLSRVSVRMLRHYDEMGLLKPAQIDRFTDYRYYREDQLPIVCRITALKDMGFSLADIVKILEEYNITIGSRWSDTLPSGSRSWKRCCAIRCIS